MQSLVFCPKHRVYWNKGNTVSQMANLSVYKSTLISTGCESWVLTCKLKSSLQAQEMRFLRRILLETGRDRLSTNYTRPVLIVQPVLNKVEQAQFRWFGHVIRMEEKQSFKELGGRGVLQERVGRTMPQECYTRGMLRAVV